jgi:hypothetical protein
LGGSPKLRKDAFDNSQPAGTTSRAKREIEVDDNGSVRGGRSDPQETPAQFQQRPAISIGQKSEVADAHSALGQHVQKVSAERG